MQLQQVDKYKSISPKDFKSLYYSESKPVVITELATRWAAYSKWNWEYFKNIVGDVEVGVYNNVKSDSYTPVNTADGYMKFGDYVDKVPFMPAGYWHHMEYMEAGYELKSLAGRHFRQTGRCLEPF